MAPYRVALFVLISSLAVAQARADERMVSPPADLKPGAEPFARCELVLRAYFIEPDGPNEVYAVSDLGAGDPEERFRNGVCIKEVNDAIRLPDDFLLWLSQLDKHSKGIMAGGRLCQAGTATRATPNDEYGTCRWARVYRNRYPYTFELESKRPLRELISHVQVYRNGELAYSWRATPVAPSMRKLVIHGRELRRSRLPHMSDFDLRIAPADLEVDEQALAELVFGEPPEVQAIRARAEQLPSGTDAALKGTLSEIAEVVSCAFGKPQKPPAPCTFGAFTLPNVAEELLLLKGQSREALERLTQRLDADLALFARKAGDTLREKRAGAEKQLEAQAAIVLEENSRDLLEQLHALRRSLADRIRAAVHQSGGREAQLELYASLVREIGERSEALDARSPNPPIMPGESAIAMRYGDNLQGFFLAAWNGVPMRLRDQVGFDFKATIAIPILDIGGIRLQWGRSRLSEFRLAGGAMVFQEENFATDRKSDSVLRVAPQISISVGTFRVGVAWVANQSDPFVDRLRLLLGVDLVKLITGTNFEAL